MKTNPKTDNVLFAVLALFVLLFGLLGQAMESGAAEQIDASNTAMSTANTAPAQEVEIQFGGSLCAVCLNAFKTRLLTMPGIKNAEIIVDKANPKSGRPPKVAHAFIGYYPEQISKANLIETFKRNDFQFIAAKDKNVSEQQHNSRE